MLRAYFLPTVKTVMTLLLGALLTFTLFEGWYYWQVLKWVDAVRINQAMAEAAQRAQQHPPEPPK